MSYNPKPKSVRSARVVNGDEHLINFKEFAPSDLCIILRLQRGHGPGTVGWKRARSLYNRWDAGKVLTIDVAQVLLNEDTEVLTMHGIETIPAGKTVYHVMDGATRVSASWVGYADNGAESKLADAVYYANVYSWPSLDDITMVVSKYFVAKNRERAAVPRADQVKMQANLDAPTAVALIETVHSLGFFLPFDADAAYAEEEGAKVVREWKRDGLLIEPVSALLNVFGYFAKQRRLGRHEAFGQGMETLEPHEMAEAVEGLTTTLRVAESLFTAADLRRGGSKQPHKDRFHGDYLYGLARLIYQNPDWAAKVTDLTHRERGAIIDRMRDVSRVHNTYGPQGYLSLSGVVSGSQGKGVITSEDGRAYWVALGITEMYNKRKQKGLLIPPMPLPQMRALLSDWIEEFGDEDEDAA